MEASSVLVKKLGKDACGNGSRQNVDWRDLSEAECFEGIVSGFLEDSVCLRLLILSMEKSENQVLVFIFRSYVQ